MELVIRGRRIGNEDLALIRALLADPSNGCRTYVSRRLCEAWNWTQPDGTPKEAACRALLLELERRELIRLPRRRTGGIGQRRRSLRQAELPLALQPACAALDTRPFRVDWRLASGRDTVLYKGLLDAHHYLGYRREVGPNLRYLARAGEHPVGAVGWAAAAQKVAARDAWIGWTAAQRLQNLHLVVNNTRFLVLGRVPHLASHLLAANVRRIARDWQARYGCEPVLLETFVDTTRFKGTCYKAANWVFAGLTQGRGKYDRHTRRQETVKAVFLYPLRPDFREILRHG